LKEACLNRRIEIVEYLVEQEVGVHRALFYTVDGDSLYIQHELRRMNFPLGSVEHKTKMRVVDLLQEKGIDYHAAKIPEKFLQKYDSTYLENY